MKIAIVETHYKSLDGGTKTSGVDYFRSISPVVYTCQQMGWEYEIFKGLGDNPSIKDYERFKSFDLVWMSYLDNSVALKYLIDTGVPINMDFDDDLINIDETNPVRQQYNLESNALKTLVWILKHLPNVSMSTKHLKQAYSPILGGVTTVLPNAIDLTEYPPFDKIPHEGVVIGWMGGITHYADLFSPGFWGAINYILGKYPQVTFSVMGMMPDLQWQGLPNFKWRDGVSDYRKYQKALPEYIGELDIAVAPLKDSFFNRSKSHIKTQEYASQSLPIVASKVTPYEEFDNKTNSIILCEGEIDWINALEKLITDVEYRKEMGKRSFGRVKQLSLEKRYKNWATYIGKIAKKPILSHSAGLARVKSVCFVPLFFGNRTGSELYVYDLAKEYLQRGIEVGVWATHYGTDYLDEAKELGITIHTSRPKKKYDIYHSQQDEPTQRALTLGKTIQTVHSEILDVEFPVAGVEKYIAVRPSIEAFVMQHTNRDVRTIFNGVDTNLFYKESKSNGKILFVGKRDFLREKALKDLEKTGALLHFQGTYEEVAEQTRKCGKTAGIMLGRTTIEGWHCGKTGIVYEVDKSGKILSKHEMPPPADLTPFTIPYMADRTLEVYQ